MIDKDILEIRNTIFLQQGVPSMNSVGFYKSPFSTDWFGRNNLNDFTYTFCRLKNSLLERIDTHISGGDRWIKIYLNVFELYPHISNLDELIDQDSLKYVTPPSSLSKMRLNQDNYKGIPLFNLASGRHKLPSSITQQGFKKSIAKLEINIVEDLTNIDFFIKRWHEINRPLRVDWNGRLYGIEHMTIEQRLIETGLKDRFYKSLGKDISEAKRILKWLEVDEKSIQEKIETTANSI